MVAEYIKYGQCRSEVSSQTDVCLNRYSRAINELRSKSHDTDIDELKRQVNEDDVILNQKRKREARNENLKSVCW